MIRKPAPLEIIEPLLKQYEKKKISLVKKIRQLLNSYSKVLTSEELYALLWYASCRNVMNFNENLYLKMSKKRIISELINKIKEVLS
jgi:hypothetical protein